MHADIYPYNIYIIEINYDKLFNFNELIYIEKKRERERERERDRNKIMHSKFSTVREN
jgi:hypothetical protein